MYGLHGGRAFGRAKIPKPGNAVLPKGENLRVQREEAKTQKANVPLKGAQDERLEMNQGTKRPISIHVIYIYIYVGLSVSNCCLLSVSACLFVCLSLRLPAGRFETIKICLETARREEREGRGDGLLPGGF